MNLGLIKICMMHFLGGLLTGFWIFVFFILHWENCLKLFCYHCVSFSFSLTFGPIFVFDDVCLFLNVL